MGYEYLSYCSLDEEDDKPERLFLSMGEGSIGKETYIRFEIM